MGRIAGCRKQHHHLQFGGVDLLVSLVGKRDELVSHTNEALAVEFAGDGGVWVEFFGTLVPVREGHSEYRLP